LGRRVPVKTWEPQGVGAVRGHVLFIGFPKFCPSSCYDECLRGIACRLVRNFEVKCWSLSFRSLSKDVLTSEGPGPLLEYLAEVVTALPLGDRFVLVDDSCGFATPLLWKLQYRIAGAMIINFTGWPSLSFTDSTLGQIFKDKRDVHAEIFRTRDVQTMVEHCTEHILCRRSEIEDIRDKFRAGLEQEEEDLFWYFFEWFALHGFHSLHNYWLQCPVLGRSTHSFLPAHEAQPLVLLSSDMAPGLIVHESIERLRSLLPGSQLDVIPRCRESWYFGNPHCVEIVGKSVERLLFKVIEQPGLRTVSVRERL